MKHLRSKSFLSGMLGLTVAMFLGCMTSRASGANEQDENDHVRQLQADAIESDFALWGHWGAKRLKYSSWTSHSNRLTPIYTFGIELDDYCGENSAYRSAKKVKQIFGRIPRNTVNPRADYVDQTDVYRLQQDAFEKGKKNIILIIFDGMDWSTTRAAAIYASQRLLYSSGRGSGLYFQDYRGCTTDFGSFVTSPHNDGTDIDVDAQAVMNPGGDKRGGYAVGIGGSHPWSQPSNKEYLLGKLRQLPHVVTDSAASATSMCSGIKTFNGAINVDPGGHQTEPIARQLQKKGFSIGIVTSVAISHATPASAYGNNVTRDDYQDLTRDLLGMPSVAHRAEPLPGVDVLLGAGWGETAEIEKDEDDKEKPSKQGSNFVPGNKFITKADLKAITVENKGRYRVVQRTKGRNGVEALKAATEKAIAEKTRLFGFFGVNRGHLPFQTADGGYNPTRGDKEAEVYTPEDISENVTLADMTASALRLLEQNEKGFWLMIEPGDVDWANHDNNIDNSIGAVLSGDDAFRVVTEWVEANDAWTDTVVILTGDHGHFLVLHDSQAFIESGD